MLSIAIRGIVGFVFLILGVVGIVSPESTRHFVSNLVEKAPVRGFGIVLMLLGAGVFRVANQLYFPLAGKVLGVALFMAGGVHILVPDFAIVMNEWWVARKIAWERVVGLAYIAMAALFLIPQEGISLPHWPSRQQPEDIRRDAVSPPEVSPQGGTPESEGSAEAPPEVRASEGETAGASPAEE